MIDQYFDLDREHAIDHALMRPVELVGPYISTDSQVQGKAENKCLTKYVFPALSGQS